MTTILIKSLISSCIAILFAGTVYAQESEQYQCSPCGRECDDTIYSNSGFCASCHMPLVKKSTITFKIIEPSNICNYINTHPNVVLLDVRTKEEFEGRANPDFGTLKNAVNIPLKELELRLSEINSFRNSEVIVYCSHSHRSPQASYILTQKGFINVINMSGGMSTLQDNDCKNAGPTPKKND